MLSCSRVLLRMYWLGLILISINSIRIEGNLASCQQTFGSNTYDLNRLSRFTLTGEYLRYGYVITPCGLVPTNQCGSNPGQFEDGMTSCQIDNVDPSNPRFESSMGFLDGYGKTPNLEFVENTDGPGTGVLMTMHNARCSGSERLVKVTFICNASVKTPIGMDVKEDPSCEFAIKIRAADACPIQSGIAGGTVFIIILLILVVVYLIGGILYNRFKHNQTGLAMLPHSSFWLLLFQSFRHGCRFTFTFIRTCGKGSSYDSV